VKHELVGGYEKNVVGYTDKISVRPGEDIAFRISSHKPGLAAAELVRLVSGDDRPHGTGLIHAPVKAEVPKEIDLSYQPIVTGSYGLVEGMPGYDAGELQITFYPTLAIDTWSTLVNCAGLIVSSSSQGVRVSLGDDEFVLSMPLATRRWHRLKLQLGALPSLMVQCLALGTAEQDRMYRFDNEASLQLCRRLPAGDWIIAASGPGKDHFNGRLEGPRMFVDGQLHSGWDFSIDIASQNIRGVGTHPIDGRLLQTPTRAVSSSSWDGTEQDYKRSPQHYDAIHFHSDDLTDAQWQDTLTVTLPTDLQSGQYALKVTQGASEDYMPFFVRARRGCAGQRTKLAYLVPTATYLAYANQRLGFSGGILGDASVRYANDAYLLAHEELGYSLYEYHSDRSGVHFSSRLRPVLNMKPRGGTWAFNADTHITAWLEAAEQPFDVITDEDLHLEGAAALQGYRCVITGTHPEYYSTAMRDGLESWLHGGNRLMYMGGNGFYWRIAYHPDNPAIIEVRRAEDGTRAWIAEPGEYYHQFGGEYGGMWRRLGRPPNDLVGIGFAAQGFDGGTYYRVQPGALDPRVRFITDGLDQIPSSRDGSTLDDTWGSFGNQGGGAAGEEIDRYDTRLGSPAHAVVVATSEGHRPGMLRVKEEFHMMQPLGNDPEVRADMVFFEVPGGGAVFSTGSISYAGSLAHNEYQNEIAHITNNVVRRFLEPEPFAMPA